MITYSNIQRYNDLDFSAYLEMQKQNRAYSFSFMKAEKFGQTEIMQETQKMRRGTLVDAILTDPAKANYLDPLYPHAKAIAARIMEQFGPFIKLFEKQVSFTATMQHLSYKIKTTGRIDFGIPGHAVIDLKVTGERDVRALIRNFKYNEQLWHYCNLYGVKTGYLMIYSIPLKRVEIIKVPVPERSEFWESKTLKFGIHSQAA